MEDLIRFFETAEAKLGAAAACEAPVCRAIFNSTTCMESALQCMSLDNIDPALVIGF